MKWLDVYKMRLVLVGFVAAIVIGGGGGSAKAEIIYVDADASTGGDGQTWGTAYKYLQDALGASVSGDQIWVADGIYRPDANTDNPTGTGDRFATFELKDGVTIKAGYAGFGEPDPNDWDIEVYETVLSGDLLGNDGQAFANNYENSYHVVTSSGTNDTAVLDGFIITAGNANGSIWFVTEVGGGMYNRNGSPTLTNCIFSGNSAVYGGGMGNYNFSNPTLTNCTFSGNSAEWDGGGMWNYNFSNPTLTNCLFIGNASAEGGGGMENWRNCSPTLTNCTFSGNSAKRGGGMQNWENCSPTLTNCILWGNTPSMGSQIDYGGGGCSVTVSYSDVQGGWPGETNIDADPCFADPDNGDCHLRSEAGRWDPVSEGWVVDDVTSPCIDCGDSNSDWRPELWPHGTRANMGAYGCTLQASRSLSDAGNVADLNRDGIVDSTDMCIMVDHWHTDEQSCDIGPLPLGDGFVDVQDLIVLAEHFFEEALPFGVVAYWKLDEAEGMFAADSVGDNDAFVVGGAVWQPGGGQIDGALQLDGVDGCAIADFVLNPADGPFSVFAWVKGGAPGQVVVSQQGAVNWLAADAEGNLMTELAGPGRFTGPLFSETAITDGQWHRIGLVWDGSNRTLYVDGLVVAEDTQPSLEGSQMGLYIGTGKAMEPGTYFSGLIDDVRIYNRAVSP